MQRTREEIYGVWVPDGGLWSPWAIPVLFAQLSETSDARGQASVGSPPPAAWLPSLDERRIVILDLDGPTAVATGLALAKSGYRPVPLFNGCHGDHAVVDQLTIMQAIRGGTAWLSSQRIPDDAPPAFLLDARRMIGLSPATPGMFDNRWKVFPQDFPAAEFLLGRGFRDCLVVQHDEPIAADLCHVLRRWQDAGLKILRQIHSFETMPAIVDVPEPPRYRSLWYRAAAQEEMKQNLRGGFGYIVPEPRHG